MITHLPIIGLLYQHDEYDTVSTPWNEFPWSIGQDNYIDEFTSGIESAYMAKTLWPINEDIYFNVVTPSAIVSGIRMWTALITMDNFGHFGSQAGSNPSDLIGSVSDIAVISGEITSVDIIEILITRSIYDEYAGMDITAEITLVETTVTLVTGVASEPNSLPEPFIGDISIISAEIKTVTLIGV